MSARIHARKAAEQKRAAEEEAQQQAYEAQADAAVAVAAQAHVVASWPVAALAAAQPVEQLHTLPQATKRKRAPAAASKPRKAGKRAAVEEMDDDEPPGDEAADADETDDDDDEAGDDAAAAAGDDSEPTAKKRKGAKQSEAKGGLRHFSILVCEKLANLGMSTYKEIADQLVAEAQLAKEKGEKKERGEEANLRRRIYDALNVLMAMDIITKERKNIRWKGFDGAGGMPPPLAPTPEPTTKGSKAGSAAAMAKSVASLTAAVAAKKAAIPDKRAQLEELVLQFCGLRALLQRNSKPDPAPSHATVTQERIPWPFLVLAAPPGIPVECTTDEPREMAILNFAEPFAVHEHTRVLQYYGQHFIQHAPTPTQESATAVIQEHTKATASAAVAAASAAAAAAAAPASPSAAIAATPPSSDSPFDTLVSAAAASPKLKPVGYRRSTMGPTDSLLLGSSVVDPRASVPPKLWACLPEQSILRPSATAFTAAHTAITATQQAQVQSQVQALAVAHTATQPIGSAAAIHGSAAVAAHAVSPFAQQAYRALAAGSMPSSLAYHYGASTGVMLQSRTLALPSIPAAAAVPIETTPPASDPLPSLVPMLPPITDATDTADMMS